MKYSVVIPSLYEVDGEYLKLCVDSLRASGFDGQIIVVTNGTKHVPNLKHIKGISTHIHTSAQGQCVAVNMGAQHVSPTVDYIMVSNSDMYYAPGWLNHVEGTEYPLVWSPNLVEPTKPGGSAAPFLILDAGNDLAMFNKEKVDKFVKAHEDNEEEPGFNLPFFIDRNLWNFLGGWDTAYDPWGSNSDTDFQTRINLAGITPMRLRDVLVYHFSNKTPTFAPENDAFRLNNFDYFYSKFGFDRDELGSDVWYNKDMLPSDPDKIKYEQRKYET